MSRRQRDLAWIPIDGAAASILADEPYPPRTAGDLTDLTSSIRIHGVITPLVLRQKGEKLQVICGYRRLLAARAAGLEEVPAQVTVMEDVEAIRFHLSENIVRRPIDPGAEEEALSLLQALRAEASRSAAEDAPGASFPREIFQGAVKAEGAEAMRDAVLRMDDLLERLRRDRSVDVAEADAIADLISDLHERGVELDLRELVRPGAVARLALHSVATAALSLDLARVLEWDASDRRRLLVASLLHDVGMVFIDRVSFEAARPLGQSERAALESHTRIGCAMITAAKGWEPEVALAARDHHERWNGDGYPSRRKTFESSRTGRLVAPLDTFAALVMPRAHRDALAPERAAERVQKAFELGLFDPSLATSFRKALDAPTLWCLGRPPAHPRLQRLAGNSVEMDGALATMLSKEST